MTNFVKLHCMTAEKLAEWLSKADKCGEGPWWKWFSDTYCKQCDEKTYFRVTTQESVLLTILRRL